MTRRTPPLAVDFRTFLTDLRLEERRIDRAHRNEGVMPDPGTVRQRLSAAISGVVSKAESEGRDTTSRELVQVQYLMAWTADRRLGELVDWSGAATFRSQPLVADFPAPEGTSPDPVAQARAVEPADAATGLPGILLFVLATTQPETSGANGDGGSGEPVDLAELRRHLYRLQTGDAPPPPPPAGRGAEAPPLLFPDAYRRISQSPTASLLPAVRPWWLASLALTAALLLIGTFLWLGASEPVRTLVHQFLGSGT
ncbi:MAG: hypothetical protein MI919_10845 [Holophagales bacterium]|nr:hypothetical protein [Holophagales bacterium]